MSTILKFSQVLLALGLIGTSAFPAQNQTTPNIVVIMSDDVGYGDLGCYGATRVKTPHLDRLAREGLRFTDAHSTASVCTPTRFAFMTGSYAWRQPGTGIAAGNATSLIKPGTRTIASLLKSAGYRTGLIGKWHLGLGENEKPDFNRAIKPGPLELGFDYAYYIPATGDRVPCVYVENHHVAGLDPTDPIQVSYGEKVGAEPTGLSHPELLKIKADPHHSQTIVNGISRIGYMAGGKAARWVDEDMADVLAAKAVDFIATNRTKPFFLFFTPHDIHEPMVPHPRFRGTSDCGWRGDVIHQLDWTVGEVLAALDRFNLTTNTLVIFTSDNGGAIKDTYDDGTNPLHSRQPPNGILRGRKSTLYEGGHRVPFLVRWPGRVAADTESRELIAQIDLFASFAALTGQTLPALAAPDSFNLLPVLLGEKSARGRDHLVLQNNHPSPLALRQGDWVLIQKNPPRRQQNAAAAAPTPELYNLRDDLTQSHDLAATEPQRVAAMQAKLREIQQAGKSTRDR